MAEYNHRKPVERFIALLEKMPMDKWDRSRGTDGSIEVGVWLGDIFEDRTSVTVRRHAREHTLFVQVSKHKKHGSGTHARSTTSMETSEFTDMPKDLQGRLSAIVDAHERFLKKKRARLDVLDDAAAEVRKQFRKWRRK